MMTAACDFLFHFKIIKVTIMALMETNVDDIMYESTQLFQK